MKVSDIEVTLIDSCGSDLSVVNAARVSFHKESSEFVDKDAGLIRYLARHKHTSPFNHAFMSFRVKAPIFVARQLVKHKFLPWNEVSRRYVDEEPEVYIPEIREKADNVKQGSGDLHPQGHALQNQVYMASVAALSAYNDLLNKGTCPEQARCVLPLNTMTEWVWSGSLGAFADMLRLRLDGHTQEESRRVAELIYAQAEPLFPVSLQALLETA